MRAEVKVYMSHTDAARIVSACLRTGESMSGLLRRCALAESDRLGVPVYTEELPGQQQLPCDASYADFDATARQGAQ